jgi:spore coat protein A, manganese oxidase
MNGRQTLRRRITCGALWLALLWSAGNAAASALVSQKALPGACIPQFATQMPVFGPGGDSPRVDAFAHPQLDVKMKEVDQAVLPQGGTDTCGLGITFGKTRVWAYETSDSLAKTVLGPAHWPAVTIEAQRHTPTVVQYQNDLPPFNFANRNGSPYVSGLLQGLFTVDQTIHWASPNGVMQQCMANPVDCTNPLNAVSACCQPFVGSPPSVPHLHGAEVPSGYDGGPEAWFTADGKRGATYRSLFATDPGKAVYLYNNSQEPGTLWFHDHALGTTRTNVYSGLAGFYFIRDAAKEPANLPQGPYEIEMAIQDRQFDANSQLYFPDGSGADAQASNLNGTPTNPDLHPFWNPEFIGDVVTVNGAPWPYRQVEPRRYLLRVLNGSNARVYNMKFGNAPVYQIGSDDNYLDAPVKVDTVTIAPGERAYLIVDFAALAGQTLTVTNDAPVPFPDGLYPVPHLDPATGETLSADQPQMANIMQFRVNPAAIADTSCDPSAGQCQRPLPTVRLTDGKGGIAPGVKIDLVRQLILKEHEGPGGPIEVLLNNTSWDGKKSHSIDATRFPNGITEVPQVGSTELWEIINMTGDTHPIHTHLVQFEILNRQNYDTDGTLGSGIANGYEGVETNDPATSIPGAWANAFRDTKGNFPAACDHADPLNPCPGYGPPLPYIEPGRSEQLSNGETAPVVGGNPDITPYLLTGPDDIELPSAEESGLKDTAKANPDEVMRIIVRWAPTSTPASENVPGVNLYPFDPTQGPGYVWHCHILDHEDNEMMRPYLVGAASQVSAAQSVVSGDLNGDGKVDIADALLALKMAVGAVTPTAQDLARGDVAPLVNGKPAPDGKVDISDVLLLLKKSVGLVNW